MERTAMLVHDFTYIQAPAVVVGARVLDASHTWIDSLATRAAGEGDALRIRLGPTGTHGPIAKRIEVRLDDPLARGAVTLIPLTWHATGAASLFPVFSGDIEVAAIGAAETQLSIWGQYDPPLGVIGEALDRFGLHRIAEASVRAFLIELRQRIEEHAREPARLLSRSV